jgi:2-amino-4-hydroxy-6-hydroxymethyldihydropteridine diphosphokinase
LREQAFISIGSNIQPERHLVLAVRRLAECGRVCAVSNVYENPAVGPPGQPDFLNAAALLDTEYSAADLRGRLTEIENSLGRERTADKFAPRTIDLDICLFGALVHDGPESIVPDPDILTRGYLAVTLAELDSGFRHPVTHESLGDIAERMRGIAELKKRTDLCLSGVA